MLFRRLPTIESLQRPPANYDRTVQVAPIWGSAPASRKKALVSREWAALFRYSFISMCSCPRPGQRERVSRELTGLAQQPPEAVAELLACDLPPPEQ